MTENSFEMACNLYVDWSEAPQNIPLTNEYFSCSNHLVFDDSTPIGSDENGKN